MPDEMDRVQELSLELVADALKAHNWNKPTGASLKSCCVCDSDIPEARRLAVPGCCKCIVCQMEFESMHGRR